MLTERGVSSEDFSLSLNPELAPLDLVFEQALLIENMPERKSARYIARLEESKVVLIRALISDQLRYINIAKEWFTIGDLAEIRRRKIGAGRIGGKAAGMILAQHILKNNPDLRDLPEFDMPGVLFHRLGRVLHLHVDQQPVPLERPEVQVRR